MRTYTKLFLQDMKTKFQILPVLFAFFVMGFCDVAGIATSYVKTDFELSETLAGFIPSMIFIWFLVLSVPTAVLMNRFGRKTIVQASNIVTIAAMLIPFFSYNFVSCMIAFALLGIGNTMLQVSLNPLLANVVKGDSLSSSLTAGQVIKAVSSFCGPLIALFAAQSLGNWKYLFPIYAAITLLAWLWLFLSKVDEDSAENSDSNSLAKAFSLLGDKKILMCFIGIFCIVGIDVGVNTVSAKLMMERAGWAVERAAVAASIYFACRTAGAFAGSFLLAWIKEGLYLKINILSAIISIAVLFFAGNATLIMVLVGLIGFFCSSIFSVLFSFALKARPDKANEISGFMITGVCGGAVIPPLMGVMTDFVGNQCGSLIVILSCMIYICFCAFLQKSEREKVQISK